MNTVYQRLSLAVAAIAVLCASPASAQQHPAGFRDPSTSTIISVLVPGGGHFYSGETTKGAIILGTGVAGLVLGTALTTESVGCDEDLNCDTDASFLPMAAGYLVYLGSWVYGIMDASDSADRMNARRGMAIGSVEVQPTVAVKPEGGTRVGLELRF